LWTDATIKLVKENFIAAAVPTWVCRTKGPEGEFLRGAGIHKIWITSSGYMTCVSASGKLLGRMASPQVLAAFQKLPEAERRPGAVQVPDLKPEERVIPSPPEGGLVLRVHARFLTRDDRGELRYAKGADFPLMADKPQTIRQWQLFLHPNTEYMWLTREEWQSLVPANPVKGEKRSVDPAIGERMARFHLYARRSMTSEGFGLSRKAVKEARLTLVTEDVSPTRIRMALEGFIHTGTDFDRAQATTPNGPLRFGFEAPIHGILEYDRTKKAFTRFDIVAVGDVWGRWGDANGKSLPVERPGRGPFAFVFELARGASPTDRIPPGGNGAMVSDRTEYFSRRGK
jgi:hypothetical protein